MENEEKIVVIKGIDIPFMDLVVLLVTVVGLLSTLFGGVFNMFMFKM